MLKGVTETTYYIVSLETVQTVPFMKDFKLLAGLIQTTL